MITHTLIEPEQRQNEARVMATLVTAFAADPPVRWTFPEPEQYLTHFPDFARAFAGKAFEHDTVDELTGRAAALWLPPDVPPDDARVMEVFHRSVAVSLLPELSDLFDQMSAHHPEEPHWYLPLIGADPTQQGKGCGSTLLRVGLARCDRDRLPAYLEATHPRNVALYERFGFRAVGRIKTKTSPVIIPMVRPRV